MKWVDLTAEIIYDTLFMGLVRVIASMCVLLVIRPRCTCKLQGQKALWPLIGANNSSGTMLPFRKDQHGPLMVYEITYWLCLIVSICGR